jgi:Ni/Co efflux regulator RcnB
MPPGHARRWAVGQRLPRDLVFYNLEPQVLSYLGPPPPRHRFVRVASDILLIAVGSGMVLDAIDDLGRN